MPALPLELLLSPWLLGLLGLAVGSFLNVIIHRLPLMLERQWWGDVAQQLSDAASHQRVLGSPHSLAAQELASTLSRSIEALPPLSLARPGSRCPACGHRLRWSENIPLLSWLLLRRRCSACGAAIPARYPLVELMSAALFAMLGWRLGPQPVSLLWCGFAALLLALSFIDWDTTLLPDGLTLPLLWAGLLASALGWTISLPQAFWGALVGYVSLWSVYWLFKLTTGKEGMGYGDFKLLSALGAWLGAPAVLPVVLVASILGAVVGIGMKFSGALREGRFVPFGPFLAGAGMLVMLIGPPRVLNWIGWS